MSNDFELPEHLRSGAMAEAAARALQDANAMAASSNSVPRISMKGRQFHLIEDGNEVAKFSEALDVHVVGVEPEPGLMIKTYYAGAYSPGAKEPPTCSSDNGRVPDPWVRDKQSPTCASCPKNVFGSATSQGTGKATKACRDSKRIWVKTASKMVLVDNDGNSRTIKLSDKPFNDRTMYGINVTVASLKSFSDYGKKLAALGQGPAVAVTRMTMVDSDYPQLAFSLAGWADAEVTPLALELSEKRPWKVKYAQAGLALAGDSASSSVRNSLPTSIDPANNIPTHLQKQAVSDVVDAVEVRAPKQASNTDIDKAVDSW